MVRRFLVAVIVCVLVWGGALLSPAAAADKYTIKEMTPEVTAALEGRRARYEELQRLKQAGRVGENNQGYVTDFSGDSAVGQTVAAENKDRKVIYETIARQNNIENALGTIEKVFAATQREKAGPGDKIQLEDGSWVTK